MKDKFNLIKLREGLFCGSTKMVPMSKSLFNEAIKLILSSKVPSEEDLQNQQFLELNQNAFDLYSGIHSRYVVTPEGLAKVYNKFLNGIYGTCPRLHCDRQRLLPLGMSDKPRAQRVKVYCPRCEESYLPNRNPSSRSSNINLDGSLFGTALPHIFMKQFPTAVVLPPKIYHYQPTIFGFHVFGKPGSKFHKPVVGTVRFTEDEESENVSNLVQ